MRPIRLAQVVAGMLIAAGSVAVPSYSSGAETGKVDNLALRRKQMDQQSARAMAQKLVATAVDNQLRQLEDNGLTEMPVYKEIKSMQGSISELVEKEMANVVKILVDAQSLKTAEQREAKFVEARTEIRTIVIKLAVERQNLLRRLKTAEIIEQAKRLIALETDTMKTTKKLPEESQTQREQLAVKTIEDQRDVKQLFLHLVETLADVSQWGGPVGEGAINGLRVLKTTDVGKHLDSAGKELDGARYLPATSEQAAAIDGLKKLLEILNKTQGAIGNDNQAVMDRVKAVLDQQAQLREQVQKADLNNLQQTNQLIEEQNKIQNELQKLAEALPESSPAEKQLEQAVEAAKEAAKDIFSNQKEEAVADQRQVEGNLAQLQKDLLAQDANPLEAMSANELAEMVRDLEQTKAQLEQAAKQEQQAADVAQEKPAEAAKLADEVKAKVDEIQKDLEKSNVPDALKSQIASADEAVEKAAAAPLEQAKPNDAKNAEPVEKAADALEQALAATQEALNEAKKMEAAVKIG